MAYTQQFSDLLRNCKKKHKDKYAAYSKAINRAKERGIEIERERKKTRKYKDPFDLNGLNL